MSILRLLSSIKHGFYDRSQPPVHFGTTKAFFLMALFLFKDSAPCPLVCKLLPVLIQLWLPGSSCMPRNHSWGQCFRHLLLWAAAGALPCLCFQGTAVSVKTVLVTLLILDFFKKLQPTQIQMLLLKKKKSPILYSCWLFSIIQL